MTKKILILLPALIFLILGFGSYAGDAPDEESLPIELTPEEMLRLDEIGKGFIKTTPPPAPMRNCAEWEPSEGVIIRWPLGISIDIVAELSEDLMVTTLVASTSYMNSAISAYSAGGVNMANTQFIIASTNSIWTRDYGPWFIFDGNDELAIVDHIYNRPRPLDDQIPWTIGTEWGMNVYGMDLIHTGGNHMSDGLGMSMSTRLVYDENPTKTPAEVDSIMLAYLGNDYTVLEYIEVTGIHHIDCWAKFLNPSTILIKDVPEGDYNHALLDARAEFLSQQISAWERPYTIVRVYCPSGTAYTNSIILNNKVFVPVFGSASDAAALKTYEDAMPGYEILGFTGSWYDDDAIHCRTMGVPDREMLFIEHVPLYIVGDTVNDYRIGVRIKDYSNQGLISDSLKVFYRTKSLTFSAAPLLPTADPDSFYAYIPAQRPGTIVSYYIQAADNSGRVETHPYIGAPWAHQFRVNFPPSILSEDTLMYRINDNIRYCPEYEDIDDTTCTVEYFDYPGWLAVIEDSLIGNAPASPTTTEFMVRVSDRISSDEKSITLIVYLCGDVNNDGGCNILDVTYFIGYLYKSGPAPAIMKAADVNNSGDINILDATYLIYYLYKSGTIPNCG